MKILTDTEIDLEEKIGVNEKVKYIVSSKHRETTNPKKSFWTIEYFEEVDCFVNNYKKKFGTTTLIWGIIIEHKAIKTLGKNKFNEELKFAKFIDSKQNKLWHGYPADYRRKNQDIPSAIVLKQWVDEKIITKAKMSKIRQGQACNL